MDGLDIPTASVSVIQADVVDHVQPPKPVVKEDGSWHYVKFVSERIISYIDFKYLGSGYLPTPTKASRISRMQRQLLWRFVNNVCFSG